MNAYVLDLLRFFAVAQSRSSPAIDPHIDQLVKAFNRHGLSTYACCQGHWDMPTGAYIAFMAQPTLDGLDQVCRLTQHLYQAQFDDVIEFHWRWQIEPTFRHVQKSWQWTAIDGYIKGNTEPIKFVVSFCLRPSPTGSWWNRLMCKLIPRGRLDRDFSKLEQLLSEFFPQLDEADNSRFVQVGQEKQKAKNQ